MSAASAASVASPPAPTARLGLLAAGRRVVAWYPLLVATLALVAAVHAIEPLPVGVFYDDAQYVVLAKSIASGNGYRFLNLPGAPIATHFPPGFPVFLALLWRISPAFPENVALFKFANAFLLALAAFGAYRFATRALRIPPSLAFTATIAGTVTIPTLVLSSAIMSEPLFLALLFPLLIWSERATQATGPGAERLEMFTAPLLGAGIGALSLVRTHRHYARSGRRRHVCHETQMAGRRRMRRRDIRHHAAMAVPRPAA